MVLALAVVFITSCGDKKEEKKDDKKTDTVATDTVKAEEAPIVVSPEMEEFMGMFDGTYQKVEEAIAKFASTEEMKEDEMGMYDMSEPGIVSAEGDCYVMEAKAGMTIRVYKLCWADGKIASIEFIEMK